MHVFIQHYLLFWVTNCSWITLLTSLASNLSVQPCLSFLAKPTVIFFNSRTITLYQEMPGCQSYLPLFSYQHIYISLLAANNEMCHTACREGMKCGITCRIRITEYCSFTHTHPTLMTPCRCKLQYPESHPVVSPFITVLDKKSVHEWSVAFINLSRK